MFETDPPAMNISDERLMELGEQRRREQLEEERRQDNFLQNLEGTALQGAENRGREQRDEISTLFRQILDSNASTGENGAALRNLKSRDIQLANFTREEVHELRWTTPIYFDMFYSMHPSNESLITGRYRAYVNDDPTDTKTPITPEEQLNIETLREPLKGRASQGRAMKLLETIKTTFNVGKTERVTREEPADDGILSKIR